MAFHFGKPQKHELHDALVEFYDERAPGYDTEGDVWHLRLAEDLVKAAKTFSPNTFKQKPVKVLDLCCGTGMVSFAAHELFGSSTIVHGVDFSAKSIEIAKAKAQGNPNLKFFTASVTDLHGLGFEKESYDLVTCCSAFVLLKDGIYALDSFAEYLKPDGILALDIPAARTQQVTDFVSQSFPEGSPIVNRAWIEGKSTMKDLLDGSDLVIRKVIETDSYKTSEYRFEDSSNIFDKMVNSPIYQGRPLSSPQLDTARSKFIKLMRGAVDDQGVLHDTYKFYIGIGAKKSEAEFRTPVSPHNNFNPQFERLRAARRRDD